MIDRQPPAGPGREYRHVTECKGIRQMGRRPEGEEALTGAERQARYRPRPGLALEEPLDQAGPRRLPRGPTLGQRWDDTVAGMVSLQAAYARWLDAMPEATHDTATGQALQAMVDLDLEEIMAIRPPRGFGRDQSRPMSSSVMSASVRTLRLHGASPCLGWSQPRNRR
jgi:hypothetical protein